MNKINRKHQKNGTPKARELRKNMTPQELKLWYRYLSKYPIRILRQKVIGGYIIDFYCSKVRASNRNRWKSADVTIFDDIKIEVINKARTLLRITKEKMYV